MTKTIIIILLFKVYFVFGQKNFTILVNYNSAEHSFKTKHYNDAIKITTKSLGSMQATDTLYEKILSLRVLSYLKVKNFDKAIADYKKLIYTNPSDLTYYVGIAYAYSELNDFKNCFYYLNEGYKVNPKDTYLLNNMAHYHNIGKDFDGAIRYANLALELNLGNDSRSFILIERSKSYTNLKMYEQALKDCNESISLSPNNSLAHYYRALANIGLNKLEMVCSDLEKAKKYAAGGLTKDLIKQYCEK